MRVTNNMMVANLLYNLEKNLNSMTRRQDELASGKKVLRASDNPIAASKILKFKTDISELKQFSDNATDALGWLEATESSLADTGEVIHRLKELGIQASNGTYSTEDMGKILTEVEQLKKQIITNGNFNFAGRYVFSGFQTDQPLFNDDGTFNIDLTSYDLNNIAKTRFQIGVGEDMEISANGLEVFGYIPASDFIAQRFPDGTASGVAATKGTLKGTPGFPIDLTTGTNGDAAMTITVNGTAYAVDQALLNQFRGTGKDSDKVKLQDLVSNAVNGGGVKLNQVADVFYDSNGQLTIRNKSYGVVPTILVQYTADSGGGVTVPDLEAAFGIPDGTTASGTDTIDALMTGPLPMTDADIAANLAEIEGQSFYLSVNGEQKKITLGTLPTSDQAGLLTAINNELTASYGNQVVAEFNIATNQLIFRTDNQTNDGHLPTLEARPIQSNESLIISEINAFETALSTGDFAGISAFVNNASTHLNRVLESRAEIGAKVNRLDLVLQRITDNNVSFTRMLSDEEDADMGEVIMYLKNSENVYKSALSTGARVIQPSLMDFLR